MHVKDGVVVDASLTPATRRFFENLAIELAANRRRSLGDTPGGRDENGADPAPIQLTGLDAIQLPFDKDGYETIEVPLEFDNQFFEMLQSDVNNIDALQADEQKNMAKEISALRDEISLVSKPSRFSKTDLALWRHIFELYLDAEVFFATGEQNHGERTSQAALTQLQWFQSEVEKRRLARDFRLRESHSALARFLKLNASLLKNLQFQELNRLAVLKILKSESHDANKPNPGKVCVHWLLATNANLSQSSTSAPRWAFPRPFGRLYNPVSSWPAVSARMSVLSSRKNWYRLCHSSTTTSAQSASPSLTALSAWHVSTYSAYAASSRSSAARRSTVRSAGRMPS